jgi:foldase protein PrsA
MPRLMLTRGIPALGAVFFAAIALAACGGGSGVPSNAVASIDGTPISKTTFNPWIVVASASTQQSATTKPAVPVPPDYTACIAQYRALEAKPAKGQKAPTTGALKEECVTEYDSLKTQVMEFLISANWVLKEASNLGIKQSDASVVKAFDVVKKTQFPTTAAYKSFLTESGQTEDDLLLREKLLLLSNDLQAKVNKGVPPITQAQVASYYAAHKSSYSTPAERNLLIVLVKTEAQAEAAKSAIEGGTSFADEAKAVSIDAATKKVGGVLDDVQEGQEEQALNNAIFSAPLNKLEGPVKTPFGYYVFQVVKATPAVTVPVAKASKTIKSTLLSTKQTAALDKYLAGFTKRWTAKTNCDKAYVVQDCKGYVAPKTASTGTTG